jgi:hypothetical protein
MDENVVDFTISVSVGWRAPVQTYLGSGYHRYDGIDYSCMHLVCADTNITASHAPHIPDTDSAVLASSDKPFAIRMIRNGGDVLRMALAYVDLLRVSGTCLKLQRARTGVLAGLEISYTATFL